LPPVGANADDGALTGWHGRQLLHGLTQDARARCAKWMAERHAAAVRVHAVARESSEVTGHTGLVADEFGAFERFDMSENLSRESFMNFP
jgi:hypothetical protein